MTHSLLLRKNQDKDTTRQLVFGSIAHSGLNTLNVGHVTGKAPGQSISLELFDRRSGPQLRGRTSTLKLFRR